MVLFLEVGVDDGEVVKEDGHQVGTVEVVVAVTRDILFDKRHAVEIAQEHPAGDTCALLGGGRSSRLSGGRSGINTLVTEFAEKASVAVVDSIGDAAEVGDEVVGGTSVDVVNRHIGRDLFIAPSDIDGMGCKDVFFTTKGITKLHISLFASPFISWSWFCKIRVHQYFSTIGIDTHTDNTTLAIVDIEGDVVFGAGGDIAHLNVVKEER